MTVAEQQIDDDLVVQHLDISQIDRSPFNRKHFDEKKFEEMVASVVQKGVMSPILVRPRARGRFELVFGERRWMASGRAGRRLIPAFVKAMSDEEVLERQAIENDQREDVHPLDQAETYHRLHQPPAGAEYPARSIEEIAAKVGRPPAYVRQRLRLVTLCEKARRAFYANEIDVSVSQVLARIPNDKLQESALAEVTRGQRMTFDEAKAHVRDHYMLLISGAPFDTSDEKLVAAAGTCTDCPKRSGNQRELFGDITKNDVCTDRACYQNKVDAHWKRLQSEAAAKGHEVLPAKDAKRLFPYGNGDLAHDAPFVDLDAVCAEDPKRRTYAKLLGRRAPKVLTRDPTGRIRQLAAKDKVRQALKRAGHQFKRTGTVAGADRALKRDGERMTRSRDATMALIGKIVEECSLAAIVDVEQLLYQNLIRTAWAGSIKLALQRRGLAEKGKRAEDLARNVFIGATSARERMAFALEIMLHSAGAYSVDGKPLAHVLEAAKYLALDANGKPLVSE